MLSTLEPSARTDRLNVYASLPFRPTDTHANTLPEMPPSSPVERISQRSHLVVPVAAAFAASVLLMVFRGDFFLADLVYAAEGHAWALRDSWATTTLLHEAGKAVVTSAWLVALLGWIWSLADRRLKRWRRPLGYLVATTLIAALMVSTLKAATAMDCPWDLQRYGGNRPFVGLLQFRPAGMPSASCFPAGHASAGYAWVTLYFFLREVRPALRWKGLATALLVGATFGISQQLRGAHFLSHDVWSLLVCWLVALAGSHLILRPGRPGAGA